MFSGQDAATYKTLKVSTVNYDMLMRVVLVLALFGGIILLSFRNYLLFHSLIELLTIVIGFMMLAIATNTGKFVGTQFGFLSFLGVAFGVVGAFDLLHVLAYKGMGVFPDNTANLATELWIIPRYLESIALLASSMLINRPGRTKRFLLVFATASLLLFASVFVFNIFPDCYVEGYGLTPFKKVSEVVISLILSVGAVLFFLKRKTQTARTFLLLAASMVFAIMSEVAFIFYIDVYGLSNMIGHVAKLVSFYLIYKAIVEVNLKNPIIELTRSEKKYADLIERLPESILIYGDRDIVFANSAATRLFGHDRLRENFFELLGRATADPLSDNAPQLERQVVRPDGSAADVEVKVLPFYHQGQQASMAIIYDVTARKSAEQANRRNAELQIEADVLRKKEQEYLEIINGSTEASWIYDFESGGLSFSDQWRQRIGGENVSVQEMNLFAMGLLHPDDVESVIQQRNAVFDNKLAKYACEYRLKAKAGDYIWVYDQGKVVYNDAGTPSKVYGTSMDITKRKIAEQALMEQNILLQNIIGNTYDDITVINQDGMTLYGQNRFTGDALPAEAGAHGDAPAFCDLDGNDVPPDRMPVNRVRNGEIVKDEVYMARTEAGSNYLLYGGKPIYNEKGQLLYGIIYSHDLTDMINMQNALKQSEQKALGLVEELKQADRNKNEFLNSLSHELRNPLAAVVAGFSLMNMTEDANRITKAKEIIQRQINQLCRLIDDLLDVTRITNNKIVLKKECIELAGLAAAVVEDHQLLFARKGLHLSIDVQQAPVALDADPVRIKQIIGNLLQNAAKFTDRGGHVAVTVSADNREAVIRIRDSGIGIRPEFLQRLFEPFHQANTSIDRSEGGLGLGLSIVKGIVDLHGGTVRADSDGLGEGSEFTICLPRPD